MEFLKQLGRQEDLERLYESPQQDTDGVALPQQLDQASGAEKLQEAHVDGVHRLGRPCQRGGVEWSGGGGGGGSGEKQGQTERDLCLCAVVGFC